MQKENKKIKVIFAINALLLGGGKQLINTFTYLPKSKFDLHLVTLFQYPGQHEFYHLIPEGVKIHKFNFKNYKDIGSWRKLYSSVREIGPDIVVSSLFFSNTIFRILKIFFGYRVITREHNTYTDKTKLQELVDRVLSIVSYKIVAVSTMVADFTAKKEKIPRDKFLVIHNGVDTRTIRQKISNLPNKDLLKKQLGFSPQDKIIINVARLAPQKNHELLFKSFAKFAKVHPEYKLIVLGDGSLKEDLAKLSKVLGMEQNIFLLGLKEDILPYYAISDLLVSTSLIEGLSNAYLEALSSGIPVVATVTAGTEEVIQEGVNGIVVREFSEEAMIKGLKEGVQLSQMTSSEGIAESISDFDIHKNISKYESLLEECYTRGHK